MRVGRPGRRLNRLAGCLSALAVFAGTTVWVSQPVAAQVAVLGIAQVGVPQPGDRPAERAVHLLPQRVVLVAQHPVHRRPDRRRAAARAGHGRRRRRARRPGPRRSTTTRPPAPPPSRCSTPCSPAPSRRSASRSSSQPGTAAGHDGHQPGHHDGHQRRDGAVEPGHGHGDGAASSWRVSKGLAPGQIAEDRRAAHLPGRHHGRGRRHPADQQRPVRRHPAPGRRRSCPPPTAATYDAGNNTVTWRPRHADPTSQHDVTVTRDVTVIFPSPPVPGRRSPQQRRRGLRRARRATPTSRSARPTSRSRCAARVTSRRRASEPRSPRSAPGQSDTYTVSGSNPNAGPARRLHHPRQPADQLSTAVQDGQPNVIGHRQPAAGQLRAERRRLPDRATSTSGGGALAATVPASADVIAGQLRHRAGRTSRPTTRSGPASRPTASDRAGNPIPRQLAHPQLRHGHRHLGRHARHASVVVHRPDGRAAVRAVLQGASPRSRSWLPAATVSWEIGRRRRRHLGR